MKNIIQCVLFSSAMVASAVAQAHSTWLLPSDTSKGNKGGWVAFDLTSSEEFFTFNGGAPKLGPIQVIAPDANTTEVQNIFEGKVRNSFEVEMTQQGTYKVFNTNSGLTARWETADGKRGFWPPRGAKADPAELATAVPKDAKNLEVTQASRRVETFVTVGAPTRESLKPTNQGLELVPVTHPNDLAASEASEFIFLMDGKPAVGAKIEVVEGGSRYRLSPAEQNYETDKNGRVKIQWKKTGMYWLGASYKDNKAAKPATGRSGSYSATFEVLAE
ncbi:ABC transporter permease [Cellvibrio zantedeschiae]|uniref:ABC transporter permease n=1 Tax=Cellvibrio zantedeschiae TaxID=1237077 RepID=A0ABQ3AX94_9GAMM|nr:DUF4198 domain-containing protein [Cellvibrio zantedeschiae]GGY69786.1 ABC transporter permease [Cellvibrio zantedeschiae]